MSISFANQGPPREVSSTAIVGRSLRMAFWITYDHLGTWIVLNLLLMLLITPLLAMSLAAVVSGQIVAGLMLFMLSAGILTPLGMVGLSAMVAEVLERHEVGWRSFPRGVRQHGARAMATGMVLALTGCCFAVSALFYTVRLGESAPVAGYLMGALSLWILVLLIPVSLLVWPALVQRKLPAVKTLQLTLMVVAANPALAFSVAGGALLIGSMSLLPPMWLLFSIAPVAVLACSAYELLARKYAPEAEGEGVAARPDQEDDHLNRGLKDLLFPWKD